MLTGLIIDEEIDIWFVLSGILRENHIKTNFVNTVAAARKILQQQVPGVLFFDAHLHDSYTSTFIGYVKSNFPKTKIVMVKDADGTDPVTSAAEADLCISKPFNTQAINEAIKTIL